MLSEYKELYKTAADVIPDWTKKSKNDLCREYVKNKSNTTLKNGYFGAVMCKYWSLISKYHRMSANCASVEECYSWLVDSVACCLNMAMWENESSSIYNDPNGPDKVINRCMKCARLTYYQFINRQKRRDSFGILSTDELQELYGSHGEEGIDFEEQPGIANISVNQEVLSYFAKKDYFVSFLLDCIVSTDVFDVNHSFNIRKLVKTMSTLDDSYVDFFSDQYKLPYSDVSKAFTYLKAVPQGSMRKKVLQTLEKLKTSNFIKSLARGY